MEKVIPFPKIINNNDTAADVINDFAESKSLITDILVVAKDTDDDVLVSMSNMDIITAMYLAQALNVYIMDYINRSEGAVN